MNTARWIFCHQMMMDAERRQLKRFARLLGIDLALFTSKGEDEDSFGPLRAFPLAAILAPDAFKRLSEAQLAEEEHSVPDEEYEAQIAALEGGSRMTELDVISAKIDEAAKAARGSKLRMQSEALPVWDPESGQPPPGVTSVSAPVSDAPTPGRSRIKMRSDKGT
jgi:hypothetical protein